MLSNSNWRSTLAFLALSGAMFPVAAQAQPANDAIWLDSLDLSKMSAGWQRPLANKSVADGPLTVKGQTFSHGIGTHADSQLALNLFGAAKRFTASVGVDDETQNKGRVVFEVYLDGKLATSVGPIKGGDAAKPISVDLTGVKQLILVVSDGEDGIDFDHADWGDAKIELVPGALTKPLPVEAPSIASVDDETPIPIYKSSKPAPEPQIHGPRVTGATPGRPFAFLVPATGDGPLSYSATGLPAGLKIDAQTGIISGNLKAAGNSVVALSVKGAKGVAKRNLVIVGGAHKLSQTPPMGWNSWNIYWCGVDEQKVRDATDWILKRGLDKHGFQYVNIDDCWQANRDANGNILVNQKFGDMKALGDYIHSKGLKFGIYSSPGPKTCAGYEGSWQHEAQDIKSYSSWGVDYLKYDWCSYGGIATGEGREYVKKPYRTMYEAIDKAERDIVYSLCQYGMGDVWKWGNDPDIRGNVWRTTGDISGSYASMRNIAFSQPDISAYSGPGHWNDPDMLFLHALKPNEQVMHLTAWSMLAAPLLIGSDLSNVSDFTVDALTNDEVLDIDQDPLGKAAVRKWSAGQLEIWARPLWDGTTAVAFYNKGRTKATITANWDDLDLSGPQPVRDLWLRRDIGVKDNSLSADVMAHGAVLFKIGKPNATEYLPR